MEKEYRTPAVVFIFVNQENKVLVEKRPATSSYPEEWVFPGGKMDKSDKNIEETLIREVNEELGVQPDLFMMIPQEEVIYSPTGRVIYPFLITRWLGDIPSYILDKENSQTNWVDLSQVILSPIESVGRLALDVNNCIKQK